MPKKILVIATLNQKKFNEIERIIRQQSTIWQPVMASKWETPFTEFPPETGETFLDNARIKSLCIAQALGQWAFGEDSGLVVEALNGRPGVFSARYGGENFNDQERYLFLLKEMAGISNRKAYFQTVISLVDPSGKEVSNFSGQVHGQILHEPSGRGGFGYDPVFQPDGFSKTMAELEGWEKDAISHRGQAIDKFLNFIP